MLVENPGGKLPFRMDDGGGDLECAVRGPGSSRLVFCLNWESQAVDLKLGITLPDGKYGGSAITTEQDAPVLIGGKAILAAADLSHFRLSPQAGEPKILAIDPSAKANRPSSAGSAHARREFTLRR